MIAESFYNTQLAQTQKKSALDTEFEQIGLDAGQNLDSFRKIKLAQFFTPLPVARFMATFFRFDRQHVKLLDPGAGAGTLFTACVMELCSRPVLPESISLTAYELDPSLLPYLKQSVNLCRELCHERRITFDARVIEADFIEDVSLRFTPPNLFNTQSSLQEYNMVILNPPYQKIGTTSSSRHYLRQAGIEVTNLYAGFLALSARLLVEGGEMVALTPRSFCNGPYFKPFRKYFLVSQKMAFTRLHLFESRQLLFEKDEVLQENIIFQAVKGETTFVVQKEMEILISSGNATGGRNRELQFHAVAARQVVDPSDPEYFVHIASSVAQDKIAKKLKGLASSLQELGLTVSTGRVVEFRAREYLSYSPEVETAPLIHPSHVRGGLVSWPEVSNNSNGKKRPLYITDSESTRDLLVPNEVYVLVKRFTTKEEARRVVAGVYNPVMLPRNIARVGFENHLNYFHEKGGGLPLNLALGLSAYLNSSHLDNYFRQFNGHTQVNATDLRNIRYPGRSQLEALGHLLLKEEYSSHPQPQQAVLDELVEALFEGQEVSAL